MANIVLSFSPNFIVLLIFRGIQAAGSASTVSIGAHGFQKGYQVLIADNY